MNPLEWPEDVPTTPPAWPEQEWCDGGWTCLHAECIDAWQQAADAIQEEAAQLDGGHDWDSEARW